jgi:hypothetical protein
MKSEIVELEKNIFYRLVKVFYIAFLSIFLLIIFFLGYSSKPKQYIDYEKSYLVCENDLYPFKNLGIHFLTSGDEILSNNFYENADRACKETNSRYLRKKELYAELERRGYKKINNDNITPEIARAELKRQKMIRQANHSAYELSVEYRIEGSWKDVIYWWFLGSGILYIALNVIKEALIYIAFGKKNSWQWLPTLLFNKIISLIKKI